MYDEADNEWPNKAVAMCKSSVAIIYDVNG